ncbi:hypothetical protein FHS15_003626 [Paenibacillus castaneae]|uniref:hypothetical protein n=1 Tax=Paenibacillus castaneae TaxID=474957 RepID=UPI000C999E72|nr:hypothetical protein [Paenibacillus castaneae]NIK78488.1 hypothetical protein [Paenibacillus castaneae]
MSDPSMSTEHYEQAVHFLKEKARPLEKAVFEHEFEGASAEAVLRELSAYQNADGGFGRALEPDIRLEGSSVLATTVALQHLVRLKATSQSSIVQSAIRYLVETYHTSQPNGWDIVPPEVDSAPRAPWWNYNAKHDGWGNPAIEIVGYFHTYPDRVPANLLDEVTQHAIIYINEKSSRKDFHELLNCLRFAALVPPSVLSEIKPALDEMVNNCVTTDPTQWDSYCLMPVQVAESPVSLYYNELSDVVIKNLSHLLSKQEADGSWSPPWGWGQFEDVWPKAELEWKGVLTLEALRRLQAYGIVSS